MPPSLAVADTHSLLWAITDKRAKLGRRARGMFERADAGAGAVYVPTLVLVEIAELVHAGCVHLNRPVEAWIQGLQRSRHYLMADLTADVVVRAHSLYAIPERGDRLIAATALALGVPLMTRDAEIAAAGVVERLWD
ncbi:MAG TPA: PIN domain-containing protein [Gemmatimonadaceae bacterium]|nr:PIN domain-containing protein [Gemmatimonadaceae bacterium]